MASAAILALIVAVFHQGDGRRARPSDVVALLVNRNSELCPDHSCLCHAATSPFESDASRVSRAPSAPGFTSAGISVETGSLSAYIPMLALPSHLIRRAFSALKVTGGRVGAAVGGNRPGLRQMRA